MAEAPVPMTATRLPARSNWWFHRAEWKISPSNLSIPSMSGIAGSVSGPTAETTKFAVKVPADVLTCHRTSCARSEEHTSELQSRRDLVCRLLLEKKKT